MSQGIQAGSPDDSGIDIGPPPRTPVAARNGRRLWPWFTVVAAVSATAIGLYAWYLYETNKEYYIFNKDADLASAGRVLEQFNDDGRLIQLREQMRGSKPVLTVTVTHEWADEYIPPTDVELQRLFGSVLGSRQIDRIVGFTPFTWKSDRLSKYEIHAKFNYTQLQDTGYGMHNDRHYGPTVHAHVQNFMRYAGNNRQVINCFYNDDIEGLENFAMHWRNARPDALEPYEMLDRIAVDGNPKTYQGKIAKHPLGLIRYPVEACPTNYQGPIAEYLTPKHY